MEFRANDPGVVKYGNFINYYQFNSAKDRIALMPKENGLWAEQENKNATESGAYVVLDIGCNCGDFTQLLYTFLSNEVPQRKIRILGIDIDPILIERAKETNGNPESIEFACVDVMDDTEKVLRDFLDSHNALRFDAVICLSITMWIHLNHGDSGLQSFLKKCSNISRLLVIEPQPWKCYQTAVKRLKKANSNFDLYSSLRWRQNIESEIDNYLGTILKLRKIFETKPTKWRRKMSFYRNFVK